MKRIYVLSLMFILMLSLLGPNLKAEDKGIDILVNAGNTMGLWSAGMNFDFHLGNNFMLSPEATVYGFSGNNFLLSPAVLLNAKFKSVFFGAGITQFILISDYDFVFSSTFLLKFNAGFRIGRFKLTVFTLTDFEFSGAAIGGSFGFRF